MTKTELLELIRNGEDSGVEFKRDEIQASELAKELVAFANFAGGVVLLGVADDGSIHGITRPNLEEWVTETCRRHIDPPLVPYLTYCRDVEPGKDVAAVRVLAGPDKPYALVHRNRRNYIIRVGSTNREASREELERLFQTSGRLRYGMKPVPGSTIGDLDRRRLRDYYRQTFAAEDTKAEPADWELELCNLELMTRTDAAATPTVDGMLLFGVNPGRFLPQSGIRALAYRGNEPDYDAAADRELRGPLVPLRTVDGDIVESGLVEQALDFVNRHTETTADFKGAVRRTRPAYPPEVLREVVVNALVHRDYSIFGTDISLTIFDNRLEVTSPGRLPNTATVAALKSGFRYARNQTLVNIMRDYGYVEYRGMGIRHKVIPGMKKHNGTEPDFIETDFSFTVRLWKEQPE